MKLPFLYERRIAKTIVSHGGHVSFFRWNPLVIQTVIVSNPGDVKLLFRCKGLQIADLRGLDLSQEVIVKVLQLKSISALFLSGNLVGPDVFELLRRRKNLYFLNVAKTKLSVDQTEALRQELTQCTVFGDDNETSLQSLFMSNGLAIDHVRSYFKQLSSKN